jgi:hypothetical protein
LSGAAQHVKGWTVPNASEMPSREERLAAKLRENLRRRKVQARALDGESAPALSKDETKS